jgi:uncharacterized protein (TIGR03435 family)
MKPISGYSFASLALFSIGFLSSSAGAQIQRGTIQGSPPTQSNVEVPARFEVASVRLRPPESGYTTINNSGSPMFSAHNVTMRLLVGLAFGMTTGNITGAPNWFDSQLYDVNAKAEGDAPLTPKQFEPLLQQFLKDRFHLTAHSETAYRPGYALVVEKSGPRLQPGDSHSRTGYIVEDGLNFGSISMEQLADVISTVTQVPVADETGLKGEYRVNLKYAPLDSTDSTLPSFRTALQDDLGLKLISDKRVPVGTLVIDTADRIPTEN